MGFYMMTHSNSPLGALQAGALARLVRVPIAIAIGGLMVSGFTVGSAMINSKVRNLGTILRQLKPAPPTSARSG